MSEQPNEHTKGKTGVGIVYKTGTSTKTSIPQSLSESNGNTTKKKTKQILKTREFIQHMRSLEKQGHEQGL